MVRSPCARTDPNVRFRPRLAFESLENRLPLSAASAVGTADVVLPLASGDTPIATVETPSEAPPAEAGGVLTPRLKDSLVSSVSQLSVVSQTDSTSWTSTSSLTSSDTSTYCSSDKLSLCGVTLDEDVQPVDQCPGLDLDYCLPKPPPLLPVTVDSPTDPDDDDGLFGGAFLP